MLIVKKNSYPEHPNVENNIKVGDEVYWVDLNTRGLYLRRVSDNKNLFAHTYKKDKDYKIVGIIAEVKSKGWVLELEKI